jgi:hypothetical protein
MEIFIHFVDVDGIATAWILPFENTAIPPPVPDHQTIVF